MMVSQDAYRPTPMGAWAQPIQERDNQIRALQAENTRLRAALLEISKLDDDVTTGAGAGKRIALRALKAN